jgi:hypothetical protein
VRGARVAIDAPTFYDDLEGVHFLN